jgi:hypothetical protein
MIGKITSRALSLSLSLFRTLNFCDLIKRASSKEKLTEYFLSENEKYYLRSLGDDERKDISNIKLIILNKIKLDPNVLIIEFNSLNLQMILIFHRYLIHQNFFPVFFVFHLH